MSPLTKAIKDRMKKINVTHRSYFLKSESSIRLCHLEQGQYKYISIPYMDYDSMMIAAQILKQCGIVDGYKSAQVNDQFYVVLIQYRYKKHTDSNGWAMSVLVPKVVEWNELSLTRDDVKQFIARFEFINTEMPTTPPVIQIKQYTPEIQILQIA